MTRLAMLAAAAGLAALACAAAPAPAEAQYRGGFHFDRGWTGPEGHFIVYARACPDLREDVRGRHRGYGRAQGRHHARGDWRDRRVLDCPPRAWRYVPSHRERRMGRAGQRLRPDVAYYDRRTGRYEVRTRWGDVPVEVVWDYAPGRRHGARGWRFSWSNGW